MSINKVVYNNNTLIDLSQDSLNLASQLVSGITAHSRDGAQITGTFQGQTKTATPSTSSQSITPSAGRWLSKVTVNPIPSDFVDLSTLNLHCTQYNSDEFASKGSRIDSVSITVGFQPKIFLVRNNAAVRGTSSTANKYWMLSSLMVYDDAGHVLHRTSFVYYSGWSSSYKYAGGQSNTNYFEPTATGVQGVGTAVYMNDNETGLYSWYAWG